ncbi:MAG: hypothetical protein ACPGOV_11810 [Magnetovibrionaceae bacterium]
MIDGDFEQAKFWVDVVWKGGTVGGLIWLAVQQRSKANSSQLKKHEGQIVEHDKKIALILKELEHSPSHEDLELQHARISDVRKSAEAIGKDVAEVGKELAELKGICKGIESSVRRLNNKAMNAEDD